MLELSVSIENCLENIIMVIVLFLTSNQYQKIIKKSDPIFNHCSFSSDDDSLPMLRRKANRGRQKSKQTNDPNEWSGIIDI